MSFVFAVEIFDKMDVVRCFNACVLLRECLRWKYKTQKCMKKMKIKAILNATYECNFNKKSLLFNKQLDDDFYEDNLIYVLTDGSINKQIGRQVDS